MDYALDSVDQEKKKPAGSLTLTELRKTVNAVESKLFKMLPCNLFQIFILDLCFTHTA